MNKKIAITGVDLCTVAGLSLASNLHGLKSAAGYTSSLEHIWNQIEVKYDTSTDIYKALQSSVLNALTLADLSPQKLALLTANGTRASIVCGSNFFETRLWEKGERDRSLLSACNSAIKQIAAELSINGVVINTSTACSSGASAQVMACQLIAAEDSDIVIVCGYDLRTRIPENGMRVIGALSKDKIQPFSMNRTGTDLADGIGVLVFERMDSAMKRRAKVYANMIGYGVASDAYNISAPDPEGIALENAMKSAIQMSGIDRNQIQYINAHGSGTPLNDELETRVIKRLFGEHSRELLINSSKSIIGHTLGAAGAIESIITVLALDNGWVHPTANFSNPDPDCDLNYCTNEYVHAELRYAMSNSIGFGGTNVSIVYEKGRAYGE